VLSGTLAYSGTSQEAVNAGGYTITPGGLTANHGNYTISYYNGALTVNPAALSVTANADIKTYNGVAYSGGNGVAYSGFVNGETTSVLGGTLAYSGDSQGAVNVGGYTITPGGLTANHGNYTISYYDGALTINQATSSLPEQNALYVTVLNSNSTTTTVIVAGDGSGGSSDSDTGKDKDKDKKGDSQSPKDGQNSGTKKQALPYCN
jgi:hypothetical protein